MTKWTLTLSAISRSRVVYSNELITEEYSYVFTSSHCLLHVWHIPSSSSSFNRFVLTSKKLKLTLRNYIFKKKFNLTFLFMNLTSVLVQTATPSFQKIEVEVEHKKREFKKEWRRISLFPTVHSHLNVALASLADFPPTNCMTHDEKSWLLALLAHSQRWDAINSCFHHPKRPLNKSASLLTWQYNWGQKRLLSTFKLTADQ